MRVSCQLDATKSGWYMAIVADISDANPKLTDNVIVQFPISHTQPVMNERMILCLFATYHSQKLA